MPCNDCQAQHDQGLKEGYKYAKEKLNTLRVQVEELHKGALCKRTQHEAFSRYQLANQMKKEEQAYSHVLELFKGV